MPETNQQAQPIQSTPAVADIVKKFPQGKVKKLLPFVLGGLLIVIVGVGSGWVLSGRKASSTGSPKGGVAPGAVSGAKVAGINDEKTFKDTATGTLDKGGINGEGQYHLTRPGGVSQNVYLTSTAVDLSAFVGKKVQVWGQTISAKEAGWLMDVGKVQVVE